MKLRGAAKGLLTAGAAVGANYAIDNYLFKDTKYGTGSMVADCALPAIAFLPTNNLVKGALMVGTHVAGKLVDNYYAAVDRRTPLISTHNIVF